MSGRLVGFVNDHGPRNHNQWAVLSVLAEDLRGPFKTSTVTDEWICDQTRLGRTTVKATIKTLDADGWISARRGVHTGTASTYALRLDRFPEDAVNELLHPSQEGSPRDPSTDSDQDREGSPHDPSLPERGRHATQEGSPHDPPSVSVTTPSLPDVDDEPLVGVLVGVAGRTDDDVEDPLTVVLADVPVKARPRATDLLREVLTIASGNGWTPDTLRAELAAARHNYERVGGGAVLAFLRATANRPAPATGPRDGTGEKCAICDNRESVCRATQRNLRDHEFAAPGTLDLRATGTDGAHRPVRAVPDSPNEKRAEERRATGTDGPSGIDPDVIARLVKHARKTRGSIRP